MVAGRPLPHRRRRHIPADFATRRSGRIAAKSSGERQHSVQKAQVQVMRKLGLLEENEPASELNINRYIELRLRLWRCFCGLQLPKEGDDGALVLGDGATEFGGGVPCAGALGGKSNTLVWDVRGSGSSQ